jgi:hypothetical protein
MKRYKKCVMCKNNKSLNNFYVNNAAADKLEYCCKQCISKKRKKATRRNGKMWLPSNGGFDEKDSHLYITYNCDICNVIFYPHRASHKRCDVCGPISRYIVHHALTCVRTYSKCPKEKLELTTLISVSKKYIHALTCCYCSREFSKDNPKSIDHIIPVCLGGNNQSDNIDISCAECNRSKGGLPLDKWIDICKRVAYKETK